MTKYHRIEHQYIDTDLLDKCLAEFEKVTIRFALGDRINPLELLAITMLKSYIENHIAAKALL